MKLRLLALVSLIALGVLIWRYTIEFDRVMSFEVTAWQENHRADCAVVLTGGVGRVREGFDLLARGAVKKLIISGVYPKAQLREIFPQWPYYGPLDEKDVILEKHSVSTYGNAIQSVSLVNALYCRDIVLVTSRLHMYRALRVFKLKLPSDYTVYPRAVVTLRFAPRWFDIWVEATKSLFYSVWAY